MALDPTRENLAFLLEVAEISNDLNGAAEPWFKELMRFSMDAAPREVLGSVSALQFALILAYGVDAGRAIERLERRGR